ncbi:phosphatase PAP2 family protein [Patescibacteria group bacterium]|nr:phosphatase PAP2 family protein [Patescibacteria group bacterium]
MDSIIVFTAQYLYLFVLAVATIFFLVQPRKIQKNMVVCGIAVAPLAYVISRIAAFFYYDPRPFVVWHFVPLIAHVADNGFPSDHVLLTGAVAAIVWFYNKKLSGALWFLVILIGTARVLAGVHHVADIAGSIAIVLLATAVYEIAVRRKKPA